MEAEGDLTTKDNERMMKIETVVMHFKMAKGVRVKKYRHSLEGRKNKETYYLPGTSRETTALSTPEF